MKFIFLTAALALATAACVSEPQIQTSADPALGASATARHQELAGTNPLGKSAADRHAPGNYYPL